MPSEPKDASIEIKHINLDLDMIIQNYANRELRDFKASMWADIVVDTGRRRVSIEWAVKK